MKLLQRQLGCIATATATVSAFQLQKCSTSTCRSTWGNGDARAFSRGAALSVPQQTKLFAWVDIDENAPRDIQTMDDWAVECGVQKADGFQLTMGYDGDENDVSCVTDQDLPANTPVLFVPNNMILSSDQAMAEFGRLEAAENLLSSLNASGQLRQYYLMIKILVEWEAGEESPWYPWLNSLPRHFNNGASMTPFCFECLPPLVASLATQERTNFIYLKNLEQVPFLSDETKANADLIKWAFQIANTRSFEAYNGYGDGTGEFGDMDLRIVPLADMFNHGTETEIDIQYDEEGNCYAQTTYDVPAGSPLRMSYGDPTNPSFLFARYGFLDETSPATFCKIMIPHVSSELLQMGYEPHRMLFYKDTGDVSQEVWDVLLYQILSASNAAKRREFYNAHVNEDAETKQAIHEAFYWETSDKLRQHVDTFLNELDLLSAKSYGKDEYEHPRLPLILKHNEFVKNTFLAVRERNFSDE